MDTRTRRSGKEKRECYFDNGWWGYDEIAGDAAYHHYRCAKCTDYPNNRRIATNRRKKEDRNE